MYGHWSIEGFTLSNNFLTNKEDGGYMYMYVLVRGLSQNSVDKWRYSVNRRQRKMKFVPQRVQEICIQIMF